MEERATEKVDEILKNHEPEPLPAEVQQELKEIVKREQEWSDKN